MLGLDVEALDVGVRVIPVPSPLTDSLDLFGGAIKVVLHEAESTS